MKNMEVSMKKHFLFSVIIMTLLSLCSCGDSSNQTSTSSSKNSTNELSSSIDTTNSAPDSYNSMEEENSSSDTSSFANDKVYEKFNELSDDKVFINLTKQEKEEYLTPILNEFIDNGNITEFNFNLDVSPPVVDFKFPNGAIGTYELEGYNPDEN